MQRLQASLLLAAFVVATAVVSGACGSSETATPAALPAPTPAPTPDEEPAPEAPPDLHAPPRQQGDAYELSTSAQEHYTSGELSSFGLSLTPRGEWHVNQEYPIHVALAAEDGVTLPKSELERADAADFGETEVRFDISFSAASAGAPRVAAHVSFAMCTAESCMFYDQTVALPLTVQ